MTQLADRFLDNVGDRPFFLYLHYQDIHEPYVREFDHVKSFAAEHGEELNRGDWMNNRSGQRATWYEPRIKNWGYDEKTRNTDQCIHELVENLDERGMLDDTVIAITSDHGELLGERGWWGHPDLPYNTLFEIPLIIHDPDRDTERVETPVSGVELPQVLTELAGVAPGSDAKKQWISNRNADDVFSGETIPQLVDYYHDAISTKGISPPLGDDAPTSQRLLVGQDWKLYAADGERHYFKYDDVFLENPLDSTAVEDTTAADLAEQLDALIHEIQAQARSSQVADPYDEVDDGRVRRQLEDLGYLE
jgi:arylsulfatase A-like enzyme